MEYVLANKSGACVFCAYAKAEESTFAEQGILSATEQAYVVQNRYPFAAGHLLVVPKRHVPDLEALPGAEHDALFRLVTRSVERLKRAVSPQGVNVGINLGKAAGAGIGEHLHVHLVPRWDGDTNFMPVMADVRVMPQYLE